MNTLPTKPKVLLNSSFISRFLQTRRTIKLTKQSGPYCDNVDYTNNNCLPFFSVMIITYNHENYIAEALDSILMQNRDFPIEINVIDDASTDNTQSVVNEYKDKYPDIINCYFNEFNVGHIATQINTYRGFQTLRGKYFALLEGDDYWTDKNKIKEQIAFLESNSEYVACAHNTLKMFDDGRPPEHFLPFKNFGRNRANMYDLIHMSGVYHLSSIVYRNIFGQTPPYCLADPYSCEVTINMVYGQYGDFYCIDKDMSGYRVHGQGEFSTRSPEDIWLFHIHGYRRFFFYLGPKYFTKFSSAILKFSRYVLKAPNTGEVEALNLSTRIIFLLHITFFMPLALIKLLPEKLIKYYRLIKQFTLDMIANAYNRINHLTPESLKKLIIRTEEVFPGIRKFRWSWKTINQKRA